MSNLLYYSYEQQFNHYLKSLKSNYDENLCKEVLLMICEYSYELKNAPSIEVQIKAKSLLESFDEVESKKIIQGL